MIGARDENVAVLKRLAQRVERLLRKLRQLVEEEHALVGERKFAGLSA